MRNVLETNKNKDNRIFNSRVMNGKIKSNWTLMLNLTTVTCFSWLFLACEKHDHSLSLLSDSRSFVQPTQYKTKDMDILWVIDNSGSMSSSQQALSDNFHRFIQRFESLGYNFHMSVTTTDAYRGTINANPWWFKFKDGSFINGYTGIFVMDKDTPNLSAVFVKNILQGTSGWGDERAFSSFKDVLSCNSTNCPENVGFRRQDAFLSIIIVSDEDDFSTTKSSSINGNYNDPTIIPTSQYVTFLNSYAGEKNFNVNAITIMDQQCLDLLNQSQSGRRIGVRYLELAQLTNGVSSSLCDDFGTNLELISNKILDLVTEFKLDREPIPETIVVTVDGVLIPSQDPLNGWTYDQTQWVVKFGTNVKPPKDAVINISFDPVAPLN